MKDYLKVIIGLVLFIALTALGFTVVNDLLRQPSVTLTNTECEPPCWAGITPGQTNSSQVYAILERMESVGLDGINADYDKNDTLTDIYWFFKRPVADNMGTVYFSDDRVSAIKILTVNSLDLADLFEKLGQPDQFWTGIGYGENNREYLQVLLFYPVKGFQAEVVIDIKSGANQVEIKPATPLFSVTYFDPHAFQELLQTRILIDIPVNARRGEFQPWSGYGAILFERE